MFNESIKSEILTTFNRVFNGCTDLKSRLSTAFDLECFGWESAFDKATDKAVFHFMKCSVDLIAQGHHTWSQDVIQFGQEPVLFGNGKTLACLKWHNLAAGVIYPRR